MQKIDEILNERQETYGDYADVAYCSQMIKKQMIKACNFKELDAYMAESLDMIANKIARICCGDQNYIDSWQDIAGYAELVVRELKKEQGQ